MGQKQKNELDMIIGLHSICEALKNPKRKNHQLFIAEESWSEFESFCAKNNFVFDKQKYALTKLSKHMLQQKAQEFARELGQNISRVPSQAFLLTAPLEFFDLTWFYDQVIAGALRKVLILDGVSDVHNGAAILRSAAFYGVNAVVVPAKGSFGQSASFFRISSGASEYIPIVEASSLVKVVGKLQDMGVKCIGLSEHAKGGLDQSSHHPDETLCLVLGAEDKGLSHALTRKLEHTLALEAKGAIKSLNVSVAAAIAMERVFNNH